MNAADVGKVLSELGLEYFPDHANPDYTIHLHDSRLWSYTVIDAISENGPWQVVPMNRSFISEPVATPEALIEELKVRGYLGGLDRVLGEEGEDTK